jgi:hypothetical protein
MEQSAQPLQTGWRHTLTNWALGGVPAGRTNYTYFVENERLLKTPCSAVTADDRAWSAFSNYKQLKGTIHPKEYTQYR